jgi:hypothetical protein
MGSQYWKLREKVNKMPEEVDTTLTQENVEIPAERSVGSITEAIERIKEEDPERASRTFFFNPAHGGYLIGTLGHKGANYKIEHPWKKNDFWLVDGERFLFLDYKDLLANPKFQKNEVNQSRFLDVLSAELSTTSATTYLQLMQGKLNSLRQDPISPEVKERLESSINKVGKALKETLFRATHLADVYSSFIKASKEHTPSVDIENDSTNPTHKRISDEINKSLAKDVNGKWQPTEAYQHVLELQS